MPRFDRDPWLGMDAAAFEAAAVAHGTPFFLYDADHVGARICAVREAFGEMVDVLYAVKANPNLALLSAVHRVADGLDVSSIGEIEQALLAGYGASSMSFAGPAKTVPELAESINRSIGCISVESSRELRDCIDVARRAGKRANVALRVNPLFLNRSFGLKMGGRSVQFGIDEEELLDAVRTVCEHPGELNFVGIHVYAGSQCFEPAGVVDGVQNTLRIVEHIEANSPLVCRTINLGGGFGVSHYDSDREMDLRGLGDALRPVLRAFLDGSAVRRRYVFELGRYLTANAGIYVTRVVSKKTSRGKNYAMVDGGLHHHLAAAGTFGAALRSNFLLRNLSRPDAETVRCTIAGPSCNPTDLLGVDVDLPRAEVGDLIGVLKSGSYGLTASPLLFLGRRTPAELVRDGGVIVLGRRPRSVTDFN